MRQARSELNQARSDEIETEAVNFYTDLESKRVQFPYIPFKEKVSEADDRWLCRAPDEKEILEAILYINPDTCARFTFLDWATPHQP